VVMVLSRDSLALEDLPSGESSDLACGVTLRVLYEI
jgi:hypothetical protein